MIEKIDEINETVKKIYQDISHNGIGTTILFATTCLFILGYIVFWFYRIQNLTSTSNDKLFKILESNEIKTENKANFYSLFSESNKKVTDLLVTSSSQHFMLASILVIISILVFCKTLKPETGIPIITSILGYILANKTMEIVNGSNGNNRSNNNLKEQSSRKDVNEDSENDETNTQNTLLDSSSVVTSDEDTGGWYWKIENLDPKKVIVGKERYKNKEECEIAGTAFRAGWLKTKSQFKQNK